MSSVRTLTLAALCAGAALLAACGEKPQTAHRKADDKPWDNGQAAFMAPGYKAADQGAWDSQLKARNQAQNEYNRTTGR